MNKMHYNPHKMQRIVITILVQLKTTRLILVVLVIMDIHREDSLETVVFMIIHLKVVLLQEFDLTNLKILGSRIIPLITVNREYFSNPDGKGTYDNGVPKADKNIQIKDNSANDTTTEVVYINDGDVA